VTAVETGVAVTLAIGLVEALKAAIAALAKRRNGRRLRSNPSNLSHAAALTEQMHEIVTARDDEGRPRIWAARTEIAKLRTIAYDNNRKLEEINHRLAKIHGAVENLRPPP
jgi:hypothetical protein